MKNAVTQAFILNTIIFLILSALVIFNSYPTLKEYNEKSQELEEVFSKFNIVTSKWLSLWDVQKTAIKHKMSQDVYTATVLREFNPEVFERYFSNTGAKIYSDFLIDVESEVVQLKNDPEYIARDKTLAKVLPVYGFWNDINQEALSDFYFINYIERLLYTFNLESSGEIGVSSLEKVENENESWWQETDGDIQESIYKIPLNLSLIGQKKNIVDFIHFLENVWSVSLVGAWIKEYEDTFIVRSLEWDEVESVNYNIYKNQIGTIDSIRLSDYPDSWTTEAGNDLIETMRTVQARQKFAININVSFYVAGVPVYQIQKYIDDFYVGFDEYLKEIELFSQKITKEKNSYTEWNQIEAVQKVQALNLLMVAFTEEISSLRTSTDIDERMFDDFAQYTLKLDRIVASFEELKALFLNDV